MKAKKRIAINNLKKWKVWNKRKKNWNEEAKMEETANKYQILWRKYSYSHWDSWRQCLVSVNIFWRHFHLVILSTNNYLCVRVCVFACMYISKKHTHTQNIESIKIFSHTVCCCLRINARVSSGRCANVLWYSSIM